MHPLEHARTESNEAPVGRGQSARSEDVAAILASLGTRRAVVMVTPALLESEIMAGLVDGFAQTGISLAGVNSCPTKRDVDGVVSLGGGSIIRSTRESAFALTGARHVAVPATMSCVEQFCDPEAPEPDAVVFDARGIQSVPRVELAAQAFNAMTFAIEAVCESSPSDRSAAAAIDAVSSLRRGLLSAISSDTLDKADAMALLMAAARAGGVARTSHAGVVRSIAESLHDRCELSYALCVAVVLPFALAFIRRACADRIALFAPAFELQAATDDVEAADGVIGAIRKLGLEAGLPRNFRNAGISREAMEGAAKAVPRLPESAGFIRPLNGPEQVMNEVFRFAW